MSHIKIEYLPNTRNFETDTGINIHFNLQSGKTRLFNDRISAYKDAKERRRFSYPVFENGETNGYYAVTD